jgi:hypothetical protein
MFFGAFIFVVTVQAAPLTLGELKELERNAVQDYRFLVGVAGGNTEKFNQDLQTKLSSLSAEQLTQLLDIKQSDLPLPLAKIRALVRLYNEQLGIFQNTYDAFTTAKTSFLLDRYFGLIEQVYADCQRTKHPQLALLTEKVERLRALHTGHHTTLHEIPLEEGSSKRFSDARHFADTLVEFWLIAVAPYRNWQEHFSFRWEKLRRFIQNGRFHFATLPGYPRALRQLKTGMEPFLGEFAPYVLKGTGSQGFSNTVRGLERLQKPTQEGTIRVIAQQHSHWLLDASTTVQFPLETSRIFNAPRFWAPDWLAKHLEKHSQFACVLGERSTETVVRVARDVREGRCDTIFIQPEGNLGTGLAFETRQPDKVFGKLLQLLGKNKNLEIFPISIPLHHQTFSDHLGENQFPRALYSVVHAPLSPSVYRLFSSLGDESAVSRLIRQHWIDSLHTHPDDTRILGSPPIENLISHLDAYLVARGKCASAALRWAAGFTVEK